MYESTPVVLTRQGCSLYPWELYVCIILNGVVLNVIVLIDQSRIVELIVLEANLIELNRVSGIV